MSILDNSNSSRIHTGKKMLSPATQGMRFLIVWCRAVTLEHVFGAGWLQRRPLPPFTARIDEFWRSCVSRFPTGDSHPQNSSSRRDAADCSTPSRDDAYSQVFTEPPCRLCFVLVFYFFMGPREDHKCRSTQCMSESLTFHITLMNSSVKYVYTLSLTNTSLSQLPLGNC